MLHARVDCPLFDSFRVQQIAGLFDVPLSARLSESFSVEVPSLAENWTVGLIVGPSGSGKSVVARAAFGGSLYESGGWPADRAVVDAVGDLSIRDITALLTAVGFSSPPSWVKPYHVLSGGEKFRCDLARAMAAGMKSTDSGRAKSGAGEPPPAAGREATPPHSAAPLVVFDEFTSVVDRTVARIGAAAVSKAIRSGRVPCRFVAVTCHYDVADWLQPDWVVDMATRSCRRRRLRRPPVRLSLFRCRREAWRLFARHHYLTGKLSPAARCFLAVWEDAPGGPAPVAFCATLPVIGRRGHWRISRIVTLPDYQGIGIGMSVAEAVADLHRAAGLRINVTASHPALLAHCRRSPRWKTVSVKRAGSASARRFIPAYRSSAGRAVVSFEYIAPSPAPPTTWDQRGTTGGER